MPHTNARWLQSFVVASVLQLYPSTDLHACTCREPVPACQETWEADAVFVAKVTTVRSTIDGDDVDVEVLEAFRGVEPGPLRMDRPMGTCSYGRFESGRTYLVFAYGRGRDLATNACSGTRPIEEASEAMEYLRGLATLASRSEGDLLGTVHGQSSASRWAPLVGVPVSITGSRGTIQVVTDARGRFAARVAPDTYVVRVEAPEGYELQPLGMAPQLRDTRGCVLVDLHLRRSP